MSCLLTASCGLDKSQMEDRVLIYAVSSSMHDSLCNKLINLYFIENAGDENDRHRQTLIPTCKACKYFK